MLTHCGEETARASSDLAEAVATKLIARGKAGCPMLEAELESALVARDPNFKPHDLPSISHMIKLVAVNTNTDIVSALEQQIRECQAGISADQFQLFLKELDYDKKAIRVHYSNLLNHDKSIKGERDSWKTKVRTDETTACKSFKAKISRTEVWNEDEKMRTSNMIAALKNFKKDLASRLQVDYNSVVSVVLLNGTAPSITSAGVPLFQPDPKRPRTLGAPDGAPHPAPAEAPWSGGRWVYNPGWGELPSTGHWPCYGLSQWFYNEGKGMEAVNIQGWLLKKGKWKDGAVLTWLCLQP